MEELLSTSRYVSTSTLNLSDVDSTLVDSDSAPEDSDVDVPTVLIPGYASCVQYGSHHVRFLIVIRKSLQLDRSISYNNFTR